VLGPAGPSTPSDAWFVSATGIESGVSLPPGRYIVAGSVYMQVAGTGATTIECSVFHGTIGSAAGRISFATVPAPVQWTLPVSDSFTLAAQSTLWIQCTNVAATTPLVSVLQVATLNGG